MLTDNPFHVRGSIGSSRSQIPPVHCRQLLSHGLSDVSRYGGHDALSLDRMPLCFVVVVGSCGAGRSSRCTIVDFEMQLSDGYGRSVRERETRAQGFDRQSILRHLLHVLSIRFEKHCQSVRHRP